MTVSLLLGLVLGRLFGMFAARRHAEEKLFAWIEEIRNLTILSRGAARRAGSHSSLGAAKPDSVLELDDTDLLAQWQAHQRGRTIQ